MRTLRTAAVVVAGTTVVLLVISVLQSAGAVHKTPDGVGAWTEPFFALAVLGPTIVGLSIAYRRPRNTVAWIMLLGPLLIALDAVDTLFDSGWGLQIGRAAWPALYAWPIAVTFVFPDGRLPSRRWRGVAAAAITSFVAFMTIAALDPRRFDPPDQAIHNPLLGNRVGEALLGTPVWVPFWLGILGSLFAGAIAIRLRLRRSSGVERLQTLWLAWSAALIPLGLLICATSWTVVDFTGVILYPFLLLMQAAVAASIAIAVFRYRLYAIERLLNRTLVYAVLSVFLIGTYAAVSVGLGVVVGRGSSWATAGATLAVALVFRPLRAVLQRGVDRRFSRRRYDAVGRVRAFEDAVRDGKRPPEDVGRVIAEALDDPSAELFLALAGGEYVSMSGESVPLAFSDDRASSEIRRDNATVGVLLHDTTLHERQDLLHGVLTAATLSVEIARLRIAVQLQLAEVEASRARIVEAGYEERRRLERDLHDGAQQRLVSLGMQIRRIQRSLPRGTEVLESTLDKIVTEVGSTIADLRQIAAGVRPARLDDGLSAALQELARMAPVPVAVDAQVERVAGSVEAAAYFVACEALTNAVKHASASRVAVHAFRKEDSIVLTVSDDGLGGAVARRGSGLAGLQDRVAAHGGTLEIVSPLGGGTRIEAAIPCE